VNPAEHTFFWRFALGQAALWTLLPALVFQNLPLDVVEGLVWGHGWPLGTYKHPPLQAWLLELAALLGGRTDVAIYAIGAGCLLLTYLAVWRLGRLLLAPSVALMGVVALSGCFYFATTIPEFNPNVVQMPLYALCGLWFWQAWQHNRWRDWLLLGLTGGLGLYGKYSFALLLASLAVFVVWEPTARRLWRNPRAWAAAALVILVFLPHLWWLQTHDWLPFAYAKSRTQLAEHMGQLLGWLGAFALNQLLVIAPVGIILWLARRPAGVTAPLPDPTAAPARRYLAALAWTPFCLMLGMALLAGGKPRDMWGMALWPFIGLWLACRWHSSWAENIWARRAVWLVLAVMPLATLSGALLGVPLGFRPWRTQFSGQALAAAADKLWQDQNMSQPMRIVLGDAWYGGNIAWYGKNRAQVMLNGNPGHSPWVDPAMVRQQGALVIWDPRHGQTAPPLWATQYGAVSAQTTVILPYGREPVPYALAIIPPQPAPVPSPQP
jgi:4-amino-4-deoxy-L-arabinose transferase-like glycosyltransferase